jgi:hypothetical protein
MNCGHPKPGRRCQPCTLKRQTQWKRDNPERVRISSHASKARNAETIRLSSHAYYVENKDRITKRNLAWREENKERFKEGTLKWRLANPENVANHWRGSRKRNIVKARARTRAWCKAHPERSREYKRANPEKVKGWWSNWSKNNADRILAKCHKRRTKLAGNGGSYTREEWAVVVLRQDGRCLNPYCRKLCKLTVEHNLPVSRGGSSYIENISGSCRRCNCAKRDKTWEEYLLSLWEVYLNQKPPRHKKAKKA